jgi:hypothetical protein
MPHAPNIVYKAIGHGRQLNLGQLGVPAVLVFVARETSEQASPIVSAIRERFPSASQVMICNIADVRGIPRLVRKPVEMLMKSSYKDAVDNLQPGRTPEEYVLILPDWDGDAFTSLEVGDVTKDVALVVLDARGERIAAASGPDAAAEVVRALESVVVAPAPQAR